MQLQFLKVFHPHLFSLEKKTKRKKFKIYKFSKIILNTKLNDARKKNKANQVALDQNPWIHLLI